MATNLSLSVSVIVLLFLTGNATGLLVVNSYKHAYFLRMQSH